MITDDLCFWIINDRLPYPVGEINPIIGRLFDENSFENTSAFYLHSYGSTILFFPDVCIHIDVFYLEISILF